jgi:hypothetical protein
MNVAPGATFEWPLEIGETGLVGTLSVAIDDGAGATVVAAATTGIIELDVGGTPTGTYVASRTAPATGGEYLLLASTDGSFDPDTVVTEQLVVTANAPFDPPTGDTYATVDELARILKIRTPSIDQENAMARVLLTATGEIDAEIDRSVDDDDLAGWQLALVAEVALERAVEHWRQQESPFGIIGIGADLMPTRSARDTWDRHALKLAPIKTRWGLA